MFVRAELRLPVSFPAAQARLASLAHRGTLLSAAQEAAGDVTTGRARVGPVGPVPGLSRVVEVQFRDLIARGDSAQLALRWEAAGPGGALFPALDADITLTRVDDRTTSMTIAGVYRPPLTGLGAELDQVILHRVATATIRDFLSRVADAIAVQQTSAERRRAARFRPLPEPGRAAEPGAAC
jgi:hypothetical protein